MLNLESLPDDEFRTNIDKKLNIIVIFSAVWCAPCNRLYKEIEQLYNDNLLHEMDIKTGSILHKNIKIMLYKIDVEKSKDIAINYNISSLPTTIFFKNGDKIFEQKGVIKKDKFNSILEEYYFS